MECFKKQRVPEWWERWAKLARRWLTLVRLPLLGCEPIAGGGIGG